jgi:hypothetical protein
MRCTPLVWAALTALGCSGNIVPDPNGEPTADLEATGAAALTSPAALSDDGFSAGMPGMPGMSATEVGQARDELGHRVPERLSQTGLYSDIASRTVAPGRRFYQPKYELWSDLADKSRWIYLPPDTQIDNSDPDHWSFPVGARFWKEFRIDGRPIETRLVQRMSEARDDFMYATYQWREDGSDADYVPDGVTNASGTAHDIPSSKGCVSCHTHLPEHVLGFSALLLSTNFEGVTLRTLDAEKLLTVPEPVDHAVPGDAVAQAALGYLHSNCGSCHNQESSADAPLTGVQLVNRFSLRLSTTQRTVGETDACVTAFEVPMSYTQTGTLQMRLVGGGPDDSGIYHRTALRGGLQMPPLATKLVDPEGLDILGRWIATLPQRGQTSCASLY